MNKFVFGLILLLGFSPAFATTLERGVSSAIAAENQPKSIELFRLSITNDINSPIAVSKDKGKTWDQIGSVLYPTEKINTQGFAAAKWIAPGQVAATAVNAVHLKVGMLEGSGAVFTLLPKEFLQSPKHYRSFLSPDSSIYTDLPAGASIFGGGYSAYVGNQVLFSRGGQAALPLPVDFRPKVGDKFFIIVERPLDYPKEMVFENRFGGRIFLKYFSGDEKLIGEVLRPVSGIGRFEGSKYAAPGRIRANHPGVLDISVSPDGYLGGFQIVPALHGEAMAYVRKGTQWMVIGPAQASDPSLEGMAPFFRYFIRPNYAADDLLAQDWADKLLERFLVEVKLNDGTEWQPIPVLRLRENDPLPDWANDALTDVTYFRVLFPISNPQ
jgi:hypothetical protein